METFKKWINSPFVIAGLLIIFGLIDLILLGIKFELSKSDWSGWVQAFGSISAMGVAIFVMSRQNANALRVVQEAERRALIRRAEAVSALVKRAHTQMHNCILHIEKNASAGKAAETRNVCKLGREITTRIREVLTPIPAHELGSFDLALGVHQTFDALTLFDHTVDAFLNDARVTAKVSALAEQCALVKKNVEIAATSFEKGMSELRQAG